MKLDIPSGFAATISKMKEYQQVVNNYENDRTLFMSRFETLMKLINNNFESKLLSNAEISSFIDKNKDDYLTKYWVKPERSTSLLKARFEVRISVCQFIIQFNLRDQEFQLYIVFINYDDETLKEILTKLNKESENVILCDSYGGNKNIFREIQTQSLSQPVWSNKDSVYQQIDIYVDILLNWMKVTIPYLKGHIISRSS